MNKKQFLFISTLSSKPFDRGNTFSDFLQSTTTKTSPPPQLGTFQLGRIISFDKLFSKLCWETFLIYILICITHDTSYNFVLNFSISSHFFVRPKADILNCEFCYIKILKFEMSKVCTTSLQRYSDIGKVSVSLTPLRYPVG